MNLDPVVSVVIPTYNEQAHIANAIGSVRRALECAVPHEIIVIDDCSSDETAAEATRAGARVLQNTSSSTIGELRNKGVAAGSGQLLVFLDADVTVTPKWGRRLHAIVDEFRSGSRTVTGSWCQVPEDAAWIEECWFGREIPSGTHLGTGHMIVTRDFFESLGGFDEQLETGEDYEFCRRAVRKGGHIRLDPQLEAVHHGFPRTVGAFVRREIWHGTGDVGSMGLLLRSKVALASLAFLVCHGLILAGLLLEDRWIGAAGVVGVVGLTVAVLIRRFDLRGELSWIRVLFLCYLYLAARSLSLFRVGKGLRSRRRDPE